jgi:hypothetical protein
LLDLDDGASMGSGSPVYLEKEAAMRDYLVVANQTLGGEHLIGRIREYTAAGPCRFHVLVPITLPTDHLWSEGEVIAVATARLETALAAIRELGGEADGQVGDSHPMRAIEDAFLDRSFDEIILSTLPPGLSRWLRLDLPRRVAARFAVPVTHVVSVVEPTETQPKAS